MSDPILLAKVRDLEVINTELKARLHGLHVKQHQHAFMTVIDALQFGGLTLDDLAAVVAPERVRAALFRTPFTP